MIIGGLAILVMYLAYRETAATRQPVPAPAAAE